MAEAEISKIQTGIPFAIDEMQALDSTPAGIGHMMFRWATASGTDAPGYWSRARDLWLRDFVIRNGALKTAVVTFVNKAVTVPISIVPHDRSISRHVNTAQEIQSVLLRNSGSMSSTAIKGWKEALKMFIFDYLTQDNGAFMLVMGDGPADGPIIGRPTGILHLDAARCTRTKNAEFPVKYEHTDGRWYMLHYTRTIEMSNLPSPNVYLNGIGLSPVSCCIEAAQELWDIYQYNAEMFGSHPPRQIVYAKTGATLNEMQAAVTAWEFKLREQNRTRFGGTLIIAPKSPKENFDMGIINLANMPDGFNRRDVTTINKSEIAAAFGLDLRDLSYLMGAPSRTGDAEVQDRKGRGKGVGEFIETFSRKFEERYLNTDLFGIRFDYLDDEQDEQESLIRDKRSTARERDLRSGVTTVRIEREIMWERGELSADQFGDIELLDGRLPNGLDVMLLFQSQDRQFKEWLNVGVPDPTDIAANDPMQMSEAIHQKIIEVSQEVHAEGNPKQARKAREALAALEKLRGMYQMPAATDGGDTTLLAAMDEGADQLESGGVPGQPAQDAKNPQSLTKEVEIGIDEIDDIIAQYHAHLRALAEQAQANEISRDTFEQVFGALIATIVLLLFQRGLGVGLDQLTEDEFALAQRLATEQVAELNGLSSDLYGGKVRDAQSLDYRLDLWLNSAASAFFTGMVHDRSDPYLMWVYGPTEHCDDCLRLNGQVHTASEWLTSPWLPRGRNLECSGYNCQCSFVPANGPSMGSF